jgi:hypothetical protein
MPIIRRLMDGLGALVLPLVAAIFVSRAVSGRRWWWCGWWRSRSARR